MRFYRKTIILKCDNQNCVAWLNKGRIPFYPWNRLLEFLFIIELLFQCRFVCEWVETEKQLADGLTRGESSVAHTFKNTSRVYKAKPHRRKACDIFFSVLCFGLPPDLVSNTLTSLKSPRKLIEKVRIPYFTHSTPAYLEEALLLLPQAFTQLDNLPTGHHEYVTSLFKYI